VAADTTSQRNQVCTPEPSGLNPLPPSAPVSGTATPIHVGTPSGSAHPLGQSSDNVDREGLLSGLLKESDMMADVDEDNNDPQWLSLHEAITQSIAAAGSADRIKRLYGNVICVGGGALVPFFAESLQYR
jgi:hypothetical protein